MEFLKQHQEDIMLILSGICGMMVIFVQLTDSMSGQRKKILSCLELSAMFLMIADRRAYVFRGDTSNLGWWMVRISNFLVFFLTLVVVYLFNRYLINLLMNEGKTEQGSAPSANLERKEQRGNGLHRHHLPEGKHRDHGNGESGYFDQQRDDHHR